MNLHDDNQDFLENADDVDNAEIEESSIFTRPQEIALKPRKSNKNLIKILTGTLALAILVTGLIVLLNLDSSDVYDPAESEHIELINLVDLDIDDIVSVAISNEHGEFTIIRTDDGDFTIEGVADYIPLSQSALRRTVTHLTEINAQRDLGANHNVEEFGLENPYVTAHIIFEDGSGIMVKIGDSNAVDTGRYIWIDGINAGGINPSSPIFLSDFMFERELTRTKYDYVEALAVEALRETNANRRFFDSGDVVGFDSLTISGTMHENPIELSWSADTLVRYHITSPANEYASAVTIEQLLSPLNIGLFASGAYAFSPTPAQISQFGLDNPRSIIEYVLGGFTLMIRVGNQDDDGNFAVKINEIPIIYRMTEGAVAFALNEMNDLIWGSIILLDISVVSAATFNFGGNSHRFELSHHTDEQDRNQTTVIYNDEIKIARDFQALYQNILQLHAISRTTNLATDEPRLTIIFELIDDEDDITLEFYFYSARRYLVKRNGQGSAIVTSENVDNIERMVPMIISGERITD